MIILDNKNFRLEAITLASESYRTWFLDVKETTRDGIVCLVNVCNGTEAYCRERLWQLHMEQFQ